MSVNDILAKHSRPSLEGIEEGPLGSYGRLVTSVSAEGLMDKISDLFSRGAGKKDLREAMGKGNLRALAALIEDTLADPDWVAKRYLVEGETYAPEVNAQWFLIDGEKVTPAKAIPYLQSTYRPWIDKFQEYASELDAAIQEIGQWVERVVMAAEPEDEERVNDAVNKALMDYASLRRPITRMRLPSPSAPGNRRMTEKRGKPVVEVHPRIKEPATVPLASEEEILAVGRWVADTLLDTAWDGYADIYGLDHSDGSGFVRRFQDNFPDAFDRFFSTLYWQSVFSEINGEDLWYDHAQYCEHAIRWCMQSLRGK